MAVITSPTVVCVFESTSENILMSTQCMIFMAILAILVTIWLTIWKKACTASTFRMVITRVHTRMATMKERTRTVINLVAMVVMRVRVTTEVVMVVVVVATVDTVVVAVVVVMVEVAYLSQITMIRLIKVTITKMRKVQIAQLVNLFITSIMIKTFTLTPVRVQQNKRSVGMGNRVDMRTRVTDTATTMTKITTKTTTVVAIIMNTTPSTTTTMMVTDTTTITMTTTLRMNTTPITRTISDGCIIRMRNIMIIITRQNTRMRGKYYLLLFFSIIYYES